MSIRPLQPLKALEYFRSLIPIPGIKDPGQWSDDRHRVAFTLAVNTDETVLDRVKRTLQAMLATGEVSDGPALIEKVLDNAGVSETKPGYAEMVMRTNLMEAYAQGSHEEMKGLEDEFPVWRYVGISDGRQRPSHDVHFDKYFPASVSFAQVRDSVKGSFDGFSCRCSSIPIHRNQWEKLQSSGARLHSFAEHESFCGGKGGKPGPCAKSAKDEEKAHKTATKDVSQKGKAEAKAAKDVAKATATHAAAQRKESAAAQKLADTTAAVKAKGKNATAKQKLAVLRAKAALAAAKVKRIEAKANLNAAVKVQKGAAALHKQATAGAAKAEKKLDKASWAGDAKAKSAPAKDKSPSQEKPAASAANTPRSATHQSMHDTIDNHPTLTPAQKTSYKQSIDQVMSRMPPAAHEAMASHVKATGFYESPAALAAGAINSMLSSVEDKLDPKLLPVVREKLTNDVIKSRTMGAYSTNDGKIHLDGGGSEGSTQLRLAKALGGEEAAQHHIYAHELSHAIDGPDFKHSNSDGWKAAHATEIYRAGEPSLTKYASTSFAEGFAEFGRLVYASGANPKAIEKQFPMASKYFKDQGLWPTTSKTKKTGTKTAKQQS